MVCQLRPLAYSLGSNNMPSISFKLVKSHIKNIRCFKQGASRCKMAGAEFPCVAKLRALTPRIDTIRITAWQSALDRAADCQPPPSGPIQTLWTVQTCGNPFSNVDFGLWQSAVRPFFVWQSADITPRSAMAGLRIWARSLTKEWNPVPTILYREAPCLKCRIYLKRDFTSLKLIRRVLFRSKLYVKGLSWHTIWWHCTFKLIVFKS
jgi:hypothetical protein